MAETDPRNVPESDMDDDGEKLDLVSLLLDMIDSVSEADIEVSPLRKDRHSADGSQGVPCPRCGKAYHPERQVHLEQTECTNGR